jgi:NADH-quinone oxidoreductase subunit E
MACQCLPNPVDTTRIDPILDAADLADADGQLIPILQKAQELYGYLPDSLLLHIAGRLGIKPAKVMGVVTFYAQFRTKPIGKHLVLLCQGTACHVNGSAEIENVIKEHLNIEEGETTKDGLFTYNNVACIGCCSLSPVLMINNKTYGKLNREKTIEALGGIEKS